VKDTFYCQTFNVGIYDSTNKNRDRGMLIVAIPRADCSYWHWHEWCTI